jgi:N-carbamoylputrescine amidase
MVNLALIQMTYGDDLGENYDKAVDYIRKAAGQGASIVCTQELFQSRYFCQAEDSVNFDLAEEIAAGSGTVAQLSELASLFEKRAVGLYHNTAVVLDADGSYLGKYHKMHIPNS